MAKTSSLYARIEPEIKEQAEAILKYLGIPVSNAITIFYKQVILNKGLPFNVCIPDAKLPNIGAMTDEAIGRELEKGYIDVLDGKTVSAESAISEFRGKRGV